MKAFIRSAGSTFEVSVMALADRYAMVRRKGCFPFVVAEKELCTNHQWVKMGDEPMRCVKCEHEPILATTQ